ncbi:DUF4012 domain-containing protein [Cryobacterium roopkundense]|uniref:DUF4012 domain-containing protein n=1 Tax=Cryobacterium roopkundense TaxID=1001240 RepID=A0A7W9E5F2_9MICO|nr:DUF4012 domain-containing protein [Cryobacterium roopkundense]MBB5642354.1 hypothetical protein [Cryobacterium roopkundense]
MEPISVLTPHGKGRSAGHKVVLRIVLAGMIVVVSATAWVGVRAVMAKDELLSAIPLAAQIRSEVVAGDGEAAGETFAELAPHAARAAMLTSDPVWRTFEYVPFIGSNLTSVRQVAGIVDELAQNAAEPLTQIVGDVKIADFKPVDGALDVQPLVAVQPQISAANVALAQARDDVQLIDSTHTFAPVTDAVAELERVVTAAAASVDTLDRAVRLLPDMLGADGARNYLLLVQNPGELRATGGVSGAMAIIHTENGRITLAEQASSEDFKSTAEPVLELPADTEAIFGDTTGRFVQSANLTPDFSLTGALTREMWRLKFGLEVDGVLTVDPATLGYLLKATGPMVLTTGETLTAENAVQLLVRDVYATYADKTQQDVFFASAAASVFTEVSAGHADPVKLIEAFARAGSEGRMLVWSAHEAEQQILADTTLAGARPVSDAQITRFGVYLNDSTGGKMDTYLDVKMGLGQQECRTNGRPSYGVSVTLTNTAPADAGTTLSSRATGGGIYGVTPGNVQTIISVYGAPGMKNVGLTRDDAAVPHNEATDSGYPVSTVEVLLAPGESTVLRFDWLGQLPFDGDLAAVGTPVVTSQTPKVLENICR